MSALNDSLYAQGVPSQSGPQGSFEAMGEARTKLWSSIKSAFRMVAELCSDVLAGMQHHEDLLARRTPYDHIRVHGIL